MTWQERGLGGAVEPFHVGLVVPDLLAHMSLLSAALGVRWTEVRRREASVTMDGETRRIAFRVVYSRELPLRLELIESVAGTPWESVAPVLHHVGWWSDDLGAEAARLEQSGIPRVAQSFDPETGLQRWSYHRVPAGYLVELVSTRGRPGHEAWWATQDVQELKGAPPSQR